ncbi:MAG: helix-turn-helix transcriptional regulator [Methylococcaceae bacterium]|nr:helix-turn-helix transcriptional regulator [Methylococcaceae bacterium]
MHFPKQLVKLRKEQGYTQQTLAEAVGLHVNQIKKYELGTAQPTLGALIKVAKVLHVSLDALVFEEGERGPEDELKLQFEAVSHMPPEDKQAIKTLLDGMIIKQRARHMFEGIGG